MTNFRFDSPVLNDSKRHGLIHEADPVDLELMAITHFDITEIANQLLTHLVGKMIEYGMTRQQPHELDFDAWVGFVDIYHKWSRTEAITRALANAQTEQEIRNAVETAIETYGDLANYCLITLHAIRRHHPDYTGAEE